jgi:hypothetical protein
VGNVQWVQETRAGTCVVRFVPFEPVCCFSLAECGCPGNGCGVVVCASSSCCWLLAKDADLVCGVCVLTSIQVYVRLACLALFPFHTSRLVPCNILSCLH